MFGINHLRRFVRRLDEATRDLSRIRDLNCAEYWERAMRIERYSDDLRLLKFGYRAYSQNDEDGIIEQIFERIGASNRSFVEFGVGNGLESNALNLLVAGWNGLWMEKDPGSVDQIRENLRLFIETEKRLLVKQAAVTAANVNDLLEQSVPFSEPDLLSIDIDGNDYWIWEALSARRPRVVVIEYNALWRPPLSVTMSYNSAHAWRGDGYYGASLKALEKLGTRKGYNLVGCCFAGVNAFFVRQDLCGNRFRAPFTAENHFEPLRLYMVGRPSGRAPGIGPLTSI